MKRNLLFVLLVLLAACSARDASEGVGSSSSALVLPTAAPLPKGWNGTRTDLAVADAWASCMATSIGNLPFLPSHEVIDGIRRDKYLEYVWGLMGTATCTSVPPDSVRMRHWHVQRSNNACNVNDAGAPASVTLPLYIMPELRTTSASLSATEDDADDMLRFPSVNLCIAQQLRNQAPGAAGLDALVLSADEQREVLETTRERAHTAMMGYALLLQLARAPQPPYQTPETPMQALQRWLRLSATPNSIQPRMRQVLADLGAMFAASVRLYTIVSGEILDLYWRSSSAKLPRGGDPQKSRVDEIWDQGSWRQRALAGLYGGDPLVPSNESPKLGTFDASPWKHPFFDPAPLGEAFQPAYGELPPHVGTDITDPMVSLLGGLVREADGLDLKQPTVKGGFLKADIDASASRLFRTAEAFMENQTCAKKTLLNPPTCIHVNPEDVPAPGNDLSAYTLWQVHRITPDHAKLLAKQLADIWGTTYNFEGGQLHDVPGALNLRGQRRTITRIGVDAGDWWHVDRDASYHDRTLEQYEGLFATLGGFPLIPDLNIGISTGNSTVDSREQGFGVDDGGSPTDYGHVVLDRRRRMGSVEALVAVREALHIAIAQPVDVAFNNELTRQDPSGLGNAIQSPAVIDGVEKLIAEAAGTTSFSVLPETTTVNVLVPIGNAVQLRRKVIQRVNTTANAPMWRAVVHSESDGFWDPAHPELFFLYAIEQNEVAAELALDPTGRSFVGETIQGLTAAAAGSGRVATNPVVSNWSSTTPTVSRFEFSIPFSEARNVTFVVVKGIPTGGPPEYRLLSAWTRFDNPGNSFRSAFTGRGGSLNAAAEKLVQVQEENPAQPQFDAFGFPVRLVPPTDPSLLGTTSGANGISLYLANAEKAADEATTAVDVAFQTLLTEQQAQLDIDKAIAKSNQVSNAQQRGLCGDATTDCAVQKLPKVQVPLFFDNNQNIIAKLKATAAPNDSAHSELAKRTLTVYAWYDVNVGVVDPVAKKLGTLTQPSFSEYEGGSLQAALIENWSAITQLRLALVTLYDAYQQADAAIGAADAELKAAQESDRANCSGGAMIEGIWAGISGSNTGVSFTAGPAIAQANRCQELNNLVQTAWTKSVNAELAAILSMTGQLVRVVDAAGRFQLSDAKISELIEQAKLATESAAFDVTLAQASLPSTKIFRRYHEYDLWRAKTLLENARRYAIVARRAVEAHYLVDFGREQKPGPFVAAPSLWVDDAYTYDLSMPGAVGLSTGTSTNDGIYPNKVKDYVRNLEHYVDGFAIANPTLSAKDDADVLSLPGPMGLRSGQSQVQVNVAGEAFRWSYYCPNTKAWTGPPATGLIGTVCGGPNPTIARLAFLMDPWGRIEGDAANVPFAARYNARWSRIAVNVVGTGVFDCTLAPDPLTCYSQPYIRYTLRHAGPAWVVDASQRWSLLSLPSGQLTGAKALAAEQWLDPLGNGWSKPYVSAVGRSEFVDRPLGGAYSLDFNIGPEVALERIDRIQLLTEASYWVTQ